MATGKKRSYGRGSVYQRASDGRWVGTIEAGWTAAGTRRRITVSATTKGKCETRLKEKTDEIAKGGAGSMSSSVTVKGYAAKWLAETQPATAPSPPRTATSTARGPACRSRCL